MTVHKVLCVDDTATDMSVDLSMYLGMIQSVVSGANLKVVSATNGKGVLSRAKSEQPDLIFLDILMRNMDGFAVMRKLQKDTPPGTCRWLSFPARVPVRVISDPMWAKMQGRKGFLPKPISPEVILDEIKKF